MCGEKHFRRKARGKIKIRQRPIHGGKTYSPFRSSTNFRLYFGGAYGIDRPPLRLNVRIPCFCVYIYSNSSAIHDVYVNRRARAWNVVGSSRFAIHNSQIYIASSIFGRWATVSGWQMAFDDIPNKNYGHFWHIKSTNSVSLTHKNCK